MNETTKQLLQDIANIVTSTERPAATKDGHDEAQRLNAALNEVYLKLNEIDAQGVDLQL